METKLFLDDERFPITVFGYTNNPIYNDNWVVVRSYNEFVEYITNLYNKTRQLPSVISFDHDLSEDENKVLLPTGMDCAKWLVDFCMDNNMQLNDFLVHSYNPTGADNIRYYLTNFKKHYKCS